MITIPDVTPGDAKLIFPSQLLESPTSLATAPTLIFRVFVFWF
jgi:hypothetical protein